MALVLPNQRLKHAGTVAKASSACLRTLKMPEYSPQYHLDMISPSLHGSSPQGPLHLFHPASNPRNATTEEM